MGRFADELAYVMPDRKTVYETYDGTNVGFYRYDADTACDLSVGTLYAMKWTQTSEAGASDLGTAAISWDELGHASASEIKTLIDAHTRTEERRRGDGCVHKCNAWGSPDNSKK